jgi:two-component system nitrogen regulation sensor histidine kinase NtrY
MQEWFSDKINNVVEETLNVANAYLKEHRQTIAGETLFISNNINSKWFEFSQNMSLLNGVLEKEIVSKGLDEAVVFNRLGKVVARAGFGLSSRQNKEMWQS